MERSSAAKHVLLAILACMVLSSCTVVLHGHGHYTAPAYRHVYLYYPACYVYYHTGTKIYYYREAGVWRAGTVVPASIRIDLSNAITVNLNTDKPYIHHKKHKKKYPPGQYKLKKKQPPGLVKKESPPGKKRVPAPPPGKKQPPVRVKDKKRPPAHGRATPPSKKKGEKLAKKDDKIRRPPPGRRPPTPKKKDEKVAKKDDKVKRTPPDRRPPTPKKKDEKVAKKDDKVKRVPARKRVYQYYPACYVYYRAETKVFYYMEGGKWKTGRAVPDSIRIAESRAVTLQLDTDRPYLKLKEHQKKYPASRYKLKKKLPPPGKKAKKK